MFARTCAALAFTFLVAASAVPAASIDGTEPQAVRPANPATIRISPEGERVASELGVGSWIWTTNFSDKQLCRVWKSFSLPPTNQVKSAVLRVTADNLYRLYIDGREAGEGGNWRSLTEYDITYLLNDSGKHVIGVEALNDSLEAGILFGLRVRFMDGHELKLLSDNTWRVADNDDKRWHSRMRAPEHWPHAQVVGVVGQPPWWLTPVSIIPTPPLRPPQLRFWQSGWFLVSILSLCAVALAMSLRLAAQLALQKRAQKLLETERARIARDIHDDLGAALTQLVLRGEVAITEFPADSKAGLQFLEICERARAASHALDEVVWAVNSKRDTLRDFSSYLCKYAQTFLAGTPIRCRLDVQPGMPATVFDLPVRRGLLLAVKEALNNAAKHSNATEVFVRIHHNGEEVVVVIDDNGQGFDLQTASDDRNGLTNMRQRLGELGGRCRIVSSPGMGCLTEFRVPLAHPSARSPLRWPRLFRKHRRPEATPGVPSNPRQQYSES